MVTLVLVLSAVSCGGKVAPAPNVGATVAAAVAVTRSENHYNKGVDYSEDGQYENAIQEYTKAIQLDPDYALSKSVMAVWYWPRFL